MASVPVLTPEGFRAAAPLLPTWWSRAFPEGPTWRVLSDAPDDTGVYLELWGVPMRGRETGVGGGGQQVESDLSDWPLAPPSASDPSLASPPPPPPPLLDLVLSFSLTHQCPVLHFRARNTNGQIMTWHDTLSLLGPAYREVCAAPRAAMEVVCPGEHPYRPNEGGFYYVHPCQTRLFLEAMAATREDDGQARGTPLAAVGLAGLASSLPFSSEGNAAGTEAAGVEESIPDISEEGIGGLTDGKSGNGRGILQLGDSAAARARLGDWGLTGEEEVGGLGGLLGFLSAHGALVGLFTYR